MRLVPRINRVCVTLNEYAGTTQVGSKTFSVYDTTVSELRKVFIKAIKVRMRRKPGRPRYKKIGRPTKKLSVGRPRKNKKMR